MTYTPDPRVLALNSGSSSLKFGLYRVGAQQLDTLLSGKAESVDSATWRIEATNSCNEPLLSETLAGPGQQAAVIRIGQLLTDSGMPAPSAIGHRVVHGGPKLREHCLIDDTVLHQLEAAAAFAPLHTPQALAVIRFAREHFPGVPQVACFDTNFHAQMPDVARVLPLPKQMLAEGIQRYGFHGLSCEGVVLQLGRDLPPRLIIAHLGNGASITAVRDGRSVDTSMGLTPSGGVIMGTRSGDLDPGVLIHLMRENKLDASMLEDLIDHRSGLAGISGVGSDMRRLHEAAIGNADARLAIEMFCYSVRKQIAAMIAVLGGVDLLVFTGGIGENDAEVRAMICSELSWCGIGLDENQNLSAVDRVSAAASSCAVRVLPSQEDEQIARHTYALVTPGKDRA